MTQPAPIKIAASPHFIVYLDANQCYLGKLILWCKRDINDFLEMNHEERDDLFKVAGQCKALLLRHFHPDRFNYTVVGAENPHLHLHLTPRYQGKREFDSVTFTDRRWGKSPRPFVNRAATPKVVAKIAKTIKSAFENIT